ncbi:MAG: hypothetical protein FWE21_08080 [Defluviitaleaceae bacterium]|nr:hypothetical protein [Defluviitaleaceae bacterium]
MKLKRKILPSVLLAILSIGIITENETFQASPASHQPLSQQIVAPSWEAPGFAVDENGVLWKVGNAIFDLSTGQRRTQLTRLMENVATISHNQPSITNDEVVHGKLYVLTNDGVLWNWRCRSYTVYEVIESVQFTRLVPVLPDFNEAPIKIMTDVNSVFAGSGHTLAVDVNGNLWAWGRNNSGQIGDGTQTDRSEPVKVMNNISTAGVDTFASWAITDDGNFYMWGATANDSFFALLRNAGAFTPVRIAEGVIAAVHGPLATYLLGEDGRLWSFSNSGEEPKVVLYNVIDVVSGSIDVLAIRSDNSLWFWTIEWGDNPYEFSLIKTEPIFIASDVVAADIGQRIIAVHVDGSIMIWDWPMGRTGVESITTVPVRMRVER